MAGEISRKQLEHDLAAAADSKRASNLAWFFKTGAGEYGEGDKFLGIRVPVQRKIALRYRELPLREISHLLKSPVHEHRFCALEILVAQYERGDEAAREAVFRFYLRHTRRINNWDLVDTSAPYIVGEHLGTRSRELLDELAKSPLVWERRIAIVSTLALIRRGELEDTFRVAEKLLPDRHDLIQKASGWALREAGRVSSAALVSFLKKHYKALPRTTLRYAIERFAPGERKRMMAGEFR